MDVVVDHLRLAVTGILTHQIRAAKLVIAVNERDRTAKLGGHVKSQRGFSRPRRAGEVYRITDFQVCERPFGQSLNMRGRHEPFTGLGQDIVPLWLHSDHSPEFSALSVHHRYAHFSIGKNQCFFDPLNGGFLAGGKGATGGRACGAVKALAAWCRCGSAFGGAGGCFSAWALAVASCASPRCFSWALGVASCASTRCFSAWALAVASCASPRCFSAWALAVASCASLRCFSWALAVASSASPRCFSWALAVASSASLRRFCLSAV